MKKFVVISILMIAALSAVFYSVFGRSRANEKSKPVESIYNLSIKGIDGKEIDFAQFKGKKLMLVNVASECGFTPQYTELQALHEKYGDKLVLIGLPCNQFGGQEPGADENIASFCTKNFGVSFLLTTKIEVSGPNQHPIYQWLTQKSKNGKLDSTVKWNFQKYLIDEDGALVDVFYSATSPMSDKITALLN